MKRREFVRTAGGATAAVGASTVATGTVAAQEGATPDFGGHLDGIDGGYEDLRGQDEVTVEVGASGNGGNLAFSPAGIWIDEGTTVTWEWTGEGGAHNVVADADNTDFENTHTDVDSGDPIDEEGYTYSYTFEEGGMTGYVCEPHRGVNMFGSVAVGDDVPVVEPGPDDGWPEDPGHWGVPIHAHWVGIVSMLGIALTFVFTFYMLKYGESAHTGHGGNQ
ncbi:halocyanin domain-containing protein [Halorubrum sp. DTA98]|uniref:halocyanin domain-containing protein n=1 Tax=Halorubrum sp. DTA98 TaxID=3402163 RepID=UPI003AB0067C